MATAIQNYLPPGSSHTIVEIVILVCVQRFVVAAELFPQCFSEARKSDCIDRLLLWANRAQTIFGVTDSEWMRNGGGDSFCDERGGSWSNEARHSHRSGITRF